MRARRRQWQRKLNSEILNISLELIVNIFRSDFVRATVHVVFPAIIIGFNTEGILNFLLICLIWLVALWVIFFLRHLFPADRAIL